MAKITKGFSVTVKEGRCCRFNESFKKEKVNSCDLLFPAGAPVFLIDIYHSNQVQQMSNQLEFFASLK
jgi:hypothetical protein